MHHRESWYLFRFVYFPVRLYIDHTSNVALASRKFKVVRGSSCYCLWHRRCKCNQAESQCTTGDKLLSQAEYTGAGFLGDVPPRAAVVLVSVRDWSTLIASLVLLVVYLVVALALGLLKAVSPYRSHWLWMVRSGKRYLDEYKEPELKSHKMTRDKHGYYVHPTTESRHIRLMDSGQEFVTNVLFFVSLPTMVCRWCYSMTREDSCYELLAHQKARDDSSQQASDCNLQQQTICCDSQKLHDLNSSECNEWRTIHNTAAMPSSSIAIFKKKINTVIYY